MRRVLATAALFLLFSATLLAQSPRRENLPKPSGPSVQPLRPVQSAEPPQPAFVGDIPVGRSPASGPGNAPVTIVEISDFQ